MANPSYRLVRYRTVEGCRAAIVSNGRTKIHVAFIDDGGVRHVAVDQKEERYMSPLEGRLDKSAKIMRRAGARLGITKAAREFLASVRP